MFNIKMRPAGNRTKTLTESEIIALMTSTCGWDIKEGRSHLYDTKEAYPLIYGGYKDGGDIDLEYERGRLTRAQADAQEKKNFVLDRKLVPLKLMEFSLSRWASAAKSLLESIPLKVKKRLPQLRAIEIIKREIVKIQNLISKVQIDWDSEETQEALKEFYK